MLKRISIAVFFGLALLMNLCAQTTQKPALHAKHWMAITGKPLAATAGASIFQQGVMP